MRAILVLRGRRVLLDAARWSHDPAAQRAGTP